MSSGSLLQNGSVKQAVPLAGLHGDILRTVPNLRAFAISLSGSFDYADDLVQETIVKALANLDKFTPGTSMQGWLFAILRNHHYSTFRKWRREVEDPDGRYAAKLTVPPAQDGYLDLDDLRAALMKLRTEQREAVLLLASGISCEEAAKICGTTIGTIKSRVNRARRRLAELLGFGNSWDIGMDGVTKAALLCA
jgi:RNA polymerase sigma-70 factor (ECF subfamily)